MPLRGEGGEKAAHDHPTIYATAKTTRARNNVNTGSNNANTQSRHTYSAKVRVFESPKGAVPSGGSYRPRSYSESVCVLNVLRVRVCVCVCGEGGRRRRRKREEKVGRGPAEGPAGCRGEGRERGSGVQSSRAAQGERPQREALNSERWRRTLHPWGLRGRGGPGRALSSSRPTPGSPFRGSRGPDRRWKLRRAPKDPGSAAAVRLTPEGAVGQAAGSRRRKGPGPRGPTLAGRGPIGRGPSSPAVWGGA